MLLLPIPLKGESKELVACGLVDVVESARKGSAAPEVNWHRGMLVRSTAREALVSEAMAMGQLSFEEVNGRRSEVF